MRFGLETRAESSLAAALDAKLDDQGRGAAACQPGEPGELQSLLATAQAIGAADAGIPRGERRSAPVWADILRQAGALPSASPHRESSRRWSGRLPRFGELATATLVFAVIAAGVFGTGLIERGRRQAATNPEIAVLLGMANQARLYPLDPTTLLTLPGAFPPASGTPSAAESADLQRPLRWSASRDGSTLVSVTDVVGASTVTIYDAPTGIVRSTFFETVSDVPGVLDATGSIVVLTARAELDDTGRPTNPQEWFVYNTKDGGRRNTITAEGVTLVPDLPPLIEPEVQRMFVLALPENWAGDPAAQSSLRLLSIDLRGGSIESETVVELDDLGLELRRDGSGNGFDVGMSLLPGWAMSNEGDVIAVVDGFGGTMWRVDTSFVEIERIALHPDVLSSDAGDFAPCDVDDRYTVAAFGPEGHTVTMGGLAVGCSPQSTLVYRSLGIGTVDLRTGDQRFASSPDAALMVLPEQPDPANVYATRIAFPEEIRFSSSGGLSISEPSEPLEVTLVRIAVDSLAIEAERPLTTEASGVVIVSGSPKVDGKTD